MLLANLGGLIKRLTDTYRSRSSYHLIIETCQCPLVSEHLPVCSFPLSLMYLHFLFFTLTTILSFHLLWLGEGHCGILSVTLWYGNLALHFPFLMYQDYKSLSNATLAVSHIFWLHIFLIVQSKYYLVSIIMHWNLFLNFQLHGNFIILLLLSKLTACVQRNMVFIRLIILTCWNLFCVPVYGKVLNVLYVLKTNVYSLIDGWRILCISTKACLLIVLFKSAVFTCFCLSIYQSLES